MITIPHSSLAAQQAAAPALSRARGAATPFRDELGQAASEIELSTASGARATASGASLPAATPAAASQSAATTAGPCLADIFPGKPSDWISASGPAPTPVPSMESVFGPHPFLDNPVERLPDGSQCQLNPIWFATPATASKVAGMLGGTVVESNEFTSTGSCVQQQQPNEMVRLPSGTLINPGQVAWLYAHGYQQSYIDARLNDLVTGIDTE
jgi:hypothetical protein